MQQTDGLKWVQQLQFIPADSIHESVAKGLEYAISDWCIAQMAKALNKKEDYEYFSKRAKLYELYFDKATRYMRGRVSSDTWRTPFNPVYAPYEKNDYTEGNAWQYTWLVPQDVHGLIRLLGGDKSFTQKLDSLFNVSSEQVEGTPPDISGMIGQYAHGNEPNHHIPYLYAYAGEPYKTATLIRNIADTFYTNKPDGICGNDDVGETSAWYVFSALGFYPVNPAEGKYVFGSPLVDAATINTGKSVFKIKVLNNNSRNKYIQKMVLNGKAYTKSYILHSDIVKGGSLVIYMGNAPSAIWGVATGDRP
jgi:predicted alpha-1,2-mannosidase